MSEDSAHVWTCHGGGADDIWEKSLTDLEGWLNLRNTDPELQHIVLTYLRGWREGSVINSSELFLFEDLVSQQSSIGWRRFFEGWLVKEWTMAQQAYYCLIKSKRSGKRWTVELIKKMWAIAWDLWEHRNGILHEEQNLVSTIELGRLNKKIIDAYTSLRSRLLPAHDRHLISSKLPRILKKDKVFKEVWLRHAMLALGLGERGSQPGQYMSGMRNCMKRFLRPRFSDPLT